MKQYIITLYDPDDWDIFHDEMTSTCAHPFVPYRKVVCSNYLPWSDKQAYYMLTDDEANKLAGDPRIEIIELEVSQRDDVELVSGATQTAVFNRTTIDSTHKNWGLLRCTSQANPFVNSPGSVTGNFNYTLTGKGVDVLVADTGVAEGHPEFAVNPDGTGGSRVVDYDWLKLANDYGIVGLNPLGGSGINGFLGDNDGHGSNCASIAAGNTNGWARDANIYTFRCVVGRGGGIDIVTGKSIQYYNDGVMAFNLAKAFHLSKPIDPKTGYRRPTIMTNSWLYEVGTYYSMSQTVWRGTNYPTTSPNPAYGQVASRFGYRYYSVEAAAAEAMAAGVIVVACAGNNYHKVDVEGGIDYNNYFIDANNNPGGNYHRGTSPAAGTSLVNGVQWKVISVGAFGGTLGASPSLDRKADFSCSGPRVDVYAPGVTIMGAASKNYAYVDDPRNPIYKLAKISGTSQATPQVAGILACVAQARPWMNQNDARDWIIKNAIIGGLDENAAAGTGYNNFSNLQGSANRILYTPFNSGVTMNSVGAITLGGLTAQI